MGAKQTLDFRRRTKTNVASANWICFQKPGFYDFCILYCNILKKKRGCRDVKKGHSKFVSNLHTYCCCILPYNTKNNSLALLVLSEVEWAFWNNFVIFKTWKTHLSRSLDLRKNETFNINNNQPVFQKKTGSLMCSDSNTMHALCVQIVFLYRFTIFFYTFILPEINITLCFQS